MGSFSFEFGYRKGGRPWYNVWASDSELFERISDYVSGIGRRYA